jgi:hypothetical protein
MKLSCQYIYVSNDSSSVQLFVANYKCTIDLIILNYLLLYFVLCIIMYFDFHLELFLTHENGRKFCSHQGVP